MSGVVDQPNAFDRPAFFEEISNFVLISIIRQILNKNSLRFDTLVSFPMPASSDYQISL